MGTVFLHGNGGSGGGSGGMELIVVGGTTRPAKAKHNMIWVNTDKEITAYVFSATEPETLVEGMVWITIGDSGITKVPSPVGDNWITVYPISAKQYISGALVNKIVEIYQNGKWDEFIRYLYNEGDQCVALTGGWSANGVSSTSGNAIVPPTINDDHILVGQTTAASKNSDGVACTENKIFIGADNKTLYVDITAIAFPSGEDVTNFRITTSKVVNEGIVATKQIYLNKNERKTVELDVSNVPAGEYYVFFRSYYTSGSGKNRAFKIHKVWLE